ncbi:MAG: hypothetical protein ACR2P9_07170 [Gammaproteobacteria bacterium]
MQNPSTTKLTTNRIKYLHEQFELAGEVAATLQFSSEYASNFFGTDKCVSTEQISDEQLMWLEATALRFARLSNTLIRRVFRAIDAIELVDEGSLLDRFSRMEKRDLLQEAEWRQITELRNQVVSEYVIEDLSMLYVEILAKCPVLLGVMSKLEEYIRQPRFALDG